VIVESKKNQKEDLKEILYFIKISFKSIVA